ncbi:MAG: alkaline phosphatase family protein [Candidatus Competibacteraceae bacterium]|jgi:predicted AlkP superfamily phosphohydrolase/phosphomutase|nr:alkaline phosphatase family protein [Candidatus Competibacteraceae bacterium]
MPGLSKVLFIGIDAGDKDLILQWAKAGDLPNFNRLLAGSAWGVTQSPVGLYVGAIWPSFYTAVSPARHGRYCYKQLQSGSYDVQRVSPRDVQAEPFWNALSQAGKRVAVIDVPKTYPAELENGLHIVDWGSHDPDPVGFSVWPESTACEIQEKFGVDSMHSCNAFRTTSDEFRNFRDALIERVDKKTRLDSYFLEQGDWDCFVTCFSESHCVGHQCWHLHDKHHRKYDPAMRIAVGDPLKDVYRSIDKAIGTLMDKAGSDANVVVFASHGMGPHYDATFMLDDILRRLEGEKPARFKRQLASLVTPVWKLLPLRLRKLARPLRRKTRVRLGVDQVDPTPGQLACRKSFSIPNNDAYGGIRINLVGREPKGIVSPGEEYEALCKSLCADLTGLINVTSGEPLVNRVLRSADIYQGRNAHLLPDLLVEWNRSAPVSEVYSPKTGTIYGEYKKCRTGDHKPEGVFFASGPAITPGEIKQPVSVMDLAPTITSLVGVKLTGVEGKPIAAVIGDS